MFLSTNKQYFLSAKYFIPSKLFKIRGNPKDDASRITKPKASALLNKIK